MRLEQRGDEVWVWPSYPGVRLHPDIAETTGLTGTVMAEYGNKVRINDPTAEYSEEPARLELICDLGESASFAVSPIGPAERCSLLVNQIFLPPDDPSLAIERFNLLAPYAKAVEGLRLTYERTPQDTAKVVAALRERVG